MTRRTRPAWYTPEDAAADRAARYGGDPTPRAGRPAGVLAWFDGDCGRCDNPITRNVSQLVRHGDDWIHATCANGADDE
ncbi:MAG: hypothetical protein JWO15_3875 [Sphingomonadales bacterium]|nr:hypothetical protein [Sphingomonadales bacterium]